MADVVSLGARSRRPTRTTLIEVEAVVVDAVTLVAEGRRLASKLGGRPMADPDPVVDALALALWETPRVDGIAGSTFDPGLAEASGRGESLVARLAFHVDDERALLAQANGTGTSISDTAAEALVTLVRSSLPIPGLRVSDVRAATAARDAR